MPRPISEAVRAIASMNPLGSRIYLMNESVDPIAHTAGTGFAARDTTKSREPGPRIPKGRTQSYTYRF